MKLDARTSRVGALAAVALCLAGCLPDDEIRCIAFSPDGNRIAAVSVKRGVTVTDTRTGARTRVTADRVRGDRVAWSPDGTTLAFTRETSGAWTIATAGLDGVTSQVTVAPGLSSDPFFTGDNRVGWVAWEEGFPVLNLPNRTRRQHATNPVPAPDGRRIAFVDWSCLVPQVCAVRTDDGSPCRLTSETTLLGLQPGSLRWTTDSRAVTFVRITAGPGERLRWQVLESDASGNTPPRVLVSSEQPIAAALAVDSEWLWLVLQDRLVRIRRKDGAQKPVSTDGLPVSLPATAGAAGAVAFVTADQLVGLARPDAAPRFLVPDPEAQFLLAEEFYRTGRDARSRQLYAELLASVRGAEDPVLPELVGVLNAGRLGREAEAARNLARLLATGRIPAGIPVRTLWRVLGLTQLVAGVSATDARRSLEQFASLPVPAEEARETTVPGHRGLGDAGLNALAILRSGDPEAARLLGRGIQARLRGDPAATEEAFSALLRRRPESLAVQAEYLRALEGFDREVFFFSPGRRDFPMTEAAQIRHLSRFADLCVQSPLAPRARFELFRLCISARRDDQARAILAATLSSPHRAADMEGTGDFFRAYLDIPEREPWLEGAMRSVFLHPQMQPAVEHALPGPRERMAFHLCAAKLALVRGNTAEGHRSCDAAEAQWDRIPESDRTPADHLDHLRVGVFRARAAELAGEYSPAADLCANAASAAVTTSSGQFDFALEARFRASLLRAAAQRVATVEREVLACEREAGDDLVNPKWQEGPLRRTAEHFAVIAGRSADPGEQSLAALEAGIAAGKLNRPDAARAALQRAAHSPAPWIREKALAELVAIAETGNDPWNALRWSRELGAMPGLDDGLRAWLRVRAARHELRMEVNTGQARAALDEIIRNWPPDSPLGALARGVAETAP